jgi:pimeloyl-ACP methyl ester carboxylesterase
MADGRRLAYTEYGDADGTPAIYCHGFPGSRLEARLAHAAAATLGIRLIAPDRPGFGRSDFLPGRRFADWPRDLAALSDALALERFDLVGVSGGAPYAIAGGQMLGDRVRRIALVCGLGEFTGEHATAGMNRAAATAIALQRHWPTAGYRIYRHLVGPTLHRFPEAAFRILVENATTADREVLADAAVRDAVIASFSEAFHAGAAGPAHEIGLITRPWDVDPRRVRQPVTLWHGEADRTVPVAMGRRHAALLADVDAHFVPGEGHFSLIVRHVHPILANFARPG